MRRWVGWAGNYADASYTQEADPVTASPDPRHVPGPRLPGAAAHMTPSSR